MKEIIVECYQDGKDIASRHSQIPLDNFPKNAIANVEQVLDENWFP